MMEKQKSDQKFFSSQKGKIIVIVAPSGTGKSTLIKQVRQALPQLKESISYTSRSIRTGEVDGKNYFFITEEEFKKKIQKNCFLEWALVHSNFYGTSKDFVSKSLERGESLLFDLDVQGADTFKKIFDQQAFIIFIEPPSLKELEKRLHERNTDTELVIQERLRNAQHELTRKNDFDALVMNDDPQEAFEKIVRLITNVISGVVID